MELNDFQSLLKIQDFGSKVCNYIENSMCKFSRIMSLINKIEGIEKYIGKGDIFDSDYYALQLHKDIIEIIYPIEEELSMKIFELKSTQNNLIKSNNTSLIANIQIQNNRISILITQIEHAIEKIRNIIKQLNNNMIKYTKHQTI